MHNFFHQKTGVVFVNNRKKSVDFVCIAKKNEYFMCPTFFVTKKPQLEPINGAGSFC